MSYLRMQSRFTAVRHSQESAAGTISLSMALFTAFKGRLQIAPHLDEFMGGAFEEICREHAQRFSQESFPAPAQEVGRIWHADFDIDIAGRLLDGSMIYGECKWWRDLVGENILDQLIERASLTSYGRDNPKRQFIMYSGAGFTSGLQKARNFARRYCFTHASKYVARCKNGSS
jgi:hypothetical protein